MENDEENIALNISDLMASLMLFFLFISIAFMLEIKKENDSIKNIVSIYQNSKKELNEMLHNEFNKDLKKWNAEITDNNTVRFFIPFKSASNEVPLLFKDILKDFFPRYINILIDKKIKNEIKEIRIEGHTSNVWNNAKNQQEIYLNNLNLSQTRAKNVLIYLYDINNSILTKNEIWLEKKFRINGMAFAKPIKSENKINWDKSRRVEFSLETKTEEKIQQIITNINK